MTRRHPLSRFMPYGAPDLLASAEPRLTRAVLAGSSTMIAAFALALVLIPRAVERTIKIVDATIFDVDTEPTIQAYDLPKEKAPESVQPKADDLGKIEPVVEEQPVEVEPTVGTGPDILGTGTGEGTDAPPPPAGGGGEEVFPDRRDYVYVDQLPVALFEFKPEYPPFARDAGVEGLVVVHALVGKDGRVIRVEVEESRSILLLNETALEAARRCTFQPAMTNGNPVPAWVAITYNFTLH